MKKNLKIDNFLEKLDIPSMEEAVLDYWEDVHAFKKSIEIRPEDKPYVFYDGPPFATGKPHYGHLIASTIKDVIPRYFTMKGHRIERVWGWDCHGLPIENILEKELGLADRQAIEDYGIENFNNSCKNSVLRYADEWKKVIRRMGRWVDMENDYKTMDSWYMESLWWVFKQLWEKDLIYQGHKSMHICPRCSTPLSNFEVTQGYRDVKDISVFVEFKALDTQKFNNKDTFFIIWTTTPWTIPGNMLLAINPDIKYALFTSSKSEKQYIVAKDMIESVIEDEYKIIKTFKGSDLLDIPYQPVFPYFKNSENAFKTVPADFVTTTEGTGIVHISPPFGEEDYILGKKHNVPFIQHVGIDGKFTSDVTDFVGLSVKPKENPLETDIKLIKYLTENDALYKKVNVKHSYPYCWRCDTPLINYATNSWFVAVTSFKDQLLANNQKINWKPEHIKNGRFGKWLENVRDWAISRNRFWGTPLPIWKSEDGDTICVGSIEELENLSGQKVKDLHKPWIDDVVINKDGKEYHRIPEVLDCWFESGAMPYASFHYPFKNKEKFEKSFPAEFISEGQDQTRGWFYTLHVLATALTLGDNPSIPVSSETSSFKNCVTTGIVLAEDGKKMSKRLKNYPDPMLVASEYGVDSLRLYLMSSPVVRSENLNFSKKEVADMKRKVFNIWWNIFTFYQLYADKSQPLTFPNKADHVMDAWLITKTESLTKDVLEHMDNYDVVSASREMMDYINDLSTWYLRTSRDRLRSKENSQSSRVFGTSLYRLSLLFAPFTPFFSELIYQNLNIEDKKESIHHELLPTSNTSLIDEELEKEMKTLRKVVESAHAQRQKSGFKLKQPLAKVFVSSNQIVREDLYQVLKAELNVLEVEWDSDSAEDSVISTSLDLVLTDELKDMGQARQIISQIQKQRKKLGVTYDQLVSVQLPDWPKAHEAEIKEKVLANDLIKSKEFKVIPA